MCRASEVESTDTAAPLNYTCNFNPGACFLQNDCIAAIYSIVKWFAWRYLRISRDAAIISITVPCGLKYSRAEVDPFSRLLLTGASRSGRPCLRNVIRARPDKSCPQHFLLSPSSRPLACVSDTCIQIFFKFLCKES